MFQWNESKVLFSDNLPTHADLLGQLGKGTEKVLLIYDRRLENNKAVKKWIKNFPFVYPVRAGERLKDLDHLSDHIEKIFKMFSPFSPKNSGIVSLGGGTTSDFAGFLASILKRGLPVVHIPSTLLGAMDSAHGGKTALNVGGIKNQIGTFYFPQSVCIVRSLLETLPAAELQSAAGELGKVALLEGGKLWNTLNDNFNLSFEDFWKVLPDVIQAKLDLVKKDPYDQKGERVALNFGHTLGHVLESYFETQHGLAVGLGCQFAIEWSHHRGHIKELDRTKAIDFLTGPLGQPKSSDFVKKNHMMSQSKFIKHLQQDKKLSQLRQIQFVFLDKIGSSFSRSVAIESLQTEAQRQGWVR